MLNAETPVSKLEGTGRPDGRYAELSVQNPVLTYTVQGLQQATGLPRTTIYELIGQKKFETRKLGRRTLILADSVQRYIAGLPAADIRAAKAV